MPRLGSDLIVRGKMFAHRMIDVAETLAASSANRWIVNRIVDQVVGAGTSVGANLREADEAATRKEFCHLIGTVLRELSESRFWLELIAEREWIPSSRLEKLRAEAEELTKVFSVMVARVRRTDLHAKNTVRRRPSRSAPE